LSDAAVADSHCQNHAINLEEAGVMQIEQHRRHSETEQPERRRIAGRIFDVSRGFVHPRSLPAPRLKTQSNSAGG